VKSIFSSTVKQRNNASV